MVKEYQIKKTAGLCDEAVLLREEVFVKEQGFVREFDEIDEGAFHLVVFLDGEPAGVCRYFKNKDDNGYSIGRIAVRKLYRGRNIGSYLMEVAQENILADGGRQITLSAQLRAMPFYRKLGYEPEGQTYMDEYCEHIRMVKKL